MVNQLLLAREHHSDSRPVDAKTRDEKKVVLPCCTLARRRPIGGAIITTTTRASHTQCQQQSSPLPSGFQSRACLEELVKPAGGVLPWERCLRVGSLLPPITPHIKPGPLPPIQRERQASAFSSRPFGSLSGRGLARRLPCWAERERGAGGLVVGRAHARSNHRQRGVLVMMTGADPQGSLKLSAKLEGSAFPLAKNSHQKHAHVYPAASRMPKLGLLAFFLFFSLPAF